MRSCRNLPALVRQVIQAIWKRDTLFRKTRKCKSLAILRKYRAARNKVTKHEAIPSIVKNFWKAIKLLTKQKSSVPTLVHNGSSYEASCDKANIRNTYFHDCFNKNVPTIAPPPSILDPALFPQKCLCTEDEVYDLIAVLDDS